MDGYTADGKCRQYTDVSSVPRHQAIESDDALVSLDDIREAAKRLAGVALRTPLLPFRDGAYVKPESLQPTGSFKIRGAYNTLAQLPEETKRKGVVAHSSGNHAQAVARAARLLGIRAVVVMPNDAPRVKVDGVRADGAEIVFVGPHNEERVARAHEIADEQGLELVSSANDRRVIAGQGTVGLEIVEQLTELGVSGVPVVLAPVGLGGLSSGIAVAIKSLRPEARVYGVEPALAADTRESLAAGRRTPWPPELTGRTIADGLRGEAPAEIPFAHLKHYLDGVIVVEEGEIERALAIAARELRLVLEPSGAVALAGLIFQATELPPGIRIAVLSGGNVDPERYLEFLARNS
jgi:threo-3-hydroxy-L-aspartate ammonia-lyase